MEAFGAAGRVVDAKVPTDRETGRPRGFAFVEFEDDEAATKSISLLNGKELKGRALRVNLAEDRPPRAPSLGRPPGIGVRSGSPDFGGPEPDFGGRGARPVKNKGSRRNIRRRKRGFY
jgi:RNA recognition motif-containing protein